MSLNKLSLRLLVFSQVLVLIFSNLMIVAAQDSKRSAGRRVKPGAEIVFSNPTAITINTAPTTTAPTPAATYPSPITVSGMTGTVTRVAITLTGFTHPRAADLDLLLVGPGGEKLVFLSDAFFQTIPAEDMVLTFADDAAGPISFFSILNGSYQRSVDGTTDTFPAPAPAGPFTGTSFAGVFNGIDPNGSWSLYIVDDQLSNSGSINSGWSLNITTTGSPATDFANPALIDIPDMVMPSAPYGTAINVSGSTGVLSNLKVTLTGFSHARPQDADILLVSPSGESMALMSDTGGTAAISGVDITFDDAALTNIPNTAFGTGSFKPTDLGSENRDTFPNPAPLRTYHAPSAPLSSLYGFNPNGDWKLFVVDDNGTQAGAITGGWSIDITTSAATPPPALTCSAPTFTPTSYTAGTRPTNLTSADLNGDGDPDLAVVNQDSNNVSILLGNGDGTFATQSLVSVGSLPYSIVAGHFDAGSTWDLAVTNGGGSSISVLLGNGDGTFGSPANFSVGPTPLSIATGEFNGDSNTDLAVANYGGFLTGSISILLGNGSGGFTAGPSVQTRSGPAFVTVAELNPDTVDDLVVANFGASSVSTFIGTGIGTFNLGQHLNTGVGPIWLDVADYNSDSVLDLRAVNYNSDSLSGFVGQSNGTFIFSFTGSPGQNPTSITSADFTGSGTREDAITLAGTNSVKLPTNTVAVGQNPNAIRAVDLNGDTKPDLVTANSGSNNVTVALNHCAAATGNLFDFNGDRRTDYATWRGPQSTWYDFNVNPNAGVINLGRPTDKLVPADYTGDRVTDFAVYQPQTSTWTVRSANGDPIHFLSFGMPGDIPAPADYDGDGKADLAVFRPSTGHWFIRQSTNNSVIDVHWGMAGDVPVPTDYDDDDKDDIAVFRPSVGDWYILRSSDSSFQAMHWGASGDKPVPGDYDDDGLADFAVFRPTDGAWYIFRTSDNGFTAMNWGLATDIPVPGDYEGDGLFDFAVWRPSDHIFYVSRSSDNGQLYIPWGAAGDTPVPSAFVP